MAIQRLHVGPRLSQVAIHGDTVYTAGIVALCSLLGGLSHLCKLTDANIVMIFLAGVALAVTGCHRNTETTRGRPESGGF